MARYRKVDTRIWNDFKFRVLKDDAKLLFLFMMTHPFMTSLGAMRATKGGLAEERGWASRKFDAAFQEPVACGMVEFDGAASYIALPRFLRYNPPENPNVVKSWASVLDLLPECDLRRRQVLRAIEFVQALPAAFGQALPESLLKGYREPFMEVFRKSMPTPEPFPEPEPLPNRSLLRSSALQPSAPNSDQDANGRKPKKKFQKYWGPVEKFIRSQIADEIFEEQYAGIQILNISAESVSLAVQESLMETWGGRTVERLTNLITSSESGLLRGRSLEIQSIESIVDKLGDKLE